MSAAHVIKSIPRPDGKLVDLYAEMSPATVHEAMGRRGAMTAAIKPIYSGMRVWGPAVTVCCPVGDNIMLLKSIDVARAGDVIVVDMGDTAESDGWGELTSLAARVKGIKGLVTNCGVRDGLAIRDMGFPVFARGLCLKGTVKESLGTINHPISCGGVTVFPGDMIVGDDDGVVVVPQAELEEIAVKSREREEKEAKVQELLRQGKSLLELNRFDEVLVRKGCIEE